MVLMERKDTPHGFGHLGFGHSRLPFDLAQGGESFDFAQDHEPVERLVEPFRVSDFVFRFYAIKAGAPYAPLQGTSLKLRPLSGDSLQIFIDTHRGYTQLRGYNQNEVSR